jgi:sec-independent protein translocase protein TatB
MNFLGIGPFEILLILVIAIIVLGPERMATTGRSLGRLYARYRSRWQRDVDEMTRELRQELSVLQMELDEIRQTTENEIQATQSVIEKTVNTEIDLDTTLLSSQETASSADSATQPTGEELPEAEISGTVEPPEPEETESPEPAVAPAAGALATGEGSRLASHADAETGAGTVDREPLAEIEGQVESIETRLDQLENSIEKRLGDIEGQMASIEAHLGNIEGQWHQAEEEI